ncbi:GAF domain-containing protein [Achromobacter xylosoxidans]|uniref:GAF domain-containing protein n=1 Tax=Alcaligenes xylosoxydans xylosoxydans TaxID=85698 RepID=UPI001F133C25|nr:GAF domain-containing protein [Achromobacter xylosoxidans]
MQQSPALSAQDLEALAAALSRTAVPDEPHPMLRSLDGITQRAVGHRLFTALRYDLDAGLAYRLYSSAPSLYPATGTKEIATAPALRNMVENGRPLLTPDADAVRQNFPDADAIFSLGCASILNIPVYGQGRLLGQINLLHEENHFTAAQIPFCTGLAVLAALAFLPSA